MKKKINSSNSKFFCFKKETYFFGQMGSIYFLDQVLSDNHIQSFFNLTPDYLNCFDDGDFSSEGISKTVIFNYNAKACEGTISFNNAQSAENSLHAELSSVVLCITRDVKKLNNINSLNDVLNIIFKLTIAKSCNF